MNVLLIYFALVFMLIILSYVAVLSFWRYRFQGDRTVLVIWLFAAAFVLIMGSTLFLLSPGALSNGTTVTTGTLNGF